MRNILRKTITTLGATGIAAGLLISSGGAANAAVSCTAATYDSRAKLACQDAYLRSSMTPLTTQRVVGYIYEWCQVKNARGATNATTYLTNYIGGPKARAIAHGADTYLC